MMWTTWLLIAVVAMGSAPTTVQAEFNTKEKCDAAVAALLRDCKYREFSGGIPVAICVEK